MRWCPNSGPGPASRGPSVRRGVGWPGMCRPGVRRHRAWCRRQTGRPARRLAEDPADRNSVAGPGCVDPLRRTGPAGAVPAGRERSGQFVSGPRNRPVVCAAKRSVSAVGMTRSSERFSDHGWASACRAADPWAGPPHVAPTRPGSRSPRPAACSWAAFADRHWCTGRLRSTGWPWVAPERSRRRSHRPGGSLRTDPVSGHPRSAWTCPNGTCGSDGSAVVVPASRRTRGPLRMVPVRRLPGWAKGPATRSAVRGSGG